MNQVLSEQMSVTAENLAEIIHSLSEQNDAFTVTELASYIGLTPSHLNQIMRRERTLHLGVAHKITEFLQRYSETAHLISPLCAEQGREQEPESTNGTINIDHTIKQLTHKAGGKAALLNKVNEPLPSAPFEQLSYEDTLEYLELAGVLSRYLVRFGQYSAIQFIETEQFERIIEQLTLAKLNKKARTE